MPYLFIEKVCRALETSLNPSSLTTRSPLKLRHVPQPIPKRCCTGLLDHSADLPHRAPSHSKLCCGVSEYSPGDLIGHPALRPGYKTVRGALPSFNQSRSVCTIVPLKYLRWYSVADICTGRVAVRQPSPSE